MRFFLFALLAALVSNTANAELSISSNVISWPDDGWYQVQHSDTYKEVCGGGRFYTVGPGVYSVIDHSNSERFEDIVVAKSAV